MAQENFQNFQNQENAEEVEYFEDDDEMQDEFWFAEDGLMFHVRLQRNMRGRGWSVRRDGELVEITFSYRMYERFLIYTDYSPIQDPYPQELMIRNMAMAFFYNLDGEHP